MSAWYLEPLGGFFFFPTVNQMSVCEELQFCVSSFSLCCLTRGLVWCDDITGKPEVDRLVQDIGVQARFYKMSVEMEAGRESWRWELASWYSVFLVHSWRYEFKKFKSSNQFPLNPFPLSCRNEIGKGYIGNVCLCPPKCLKENRQTTANQQIEIAEENERKF